MKISKVPTAIIAAALVGCSGPQGVLQTNIGVPAAGLQPQTLEPASPANGGAFSGSYTGRASGGDDCSYGVSEYLIFHGAGKASFLGRSKESGTLMASYGSSTQCSYSGSATLTERKDPDSTVTMSITGNASTSLTYTVTSGTGRFAKARGHGVFSITVSGSMRPSLGASPLCCRHYYDEWSGKLKF
jgi:hypothetical protein